MRCIPVVARSLSATLPNIQGRVRQPQITETRMRKLKIIEHISLDGVIQVSGDDGDFPYGD